MEKLNQLDEVLKLGNKLVKELNLLPYSNVLEKWMCQYLAELLVEIENTTSVAKQKQLKKECFETILSLWKQREYLPERIAPLSNIPALISVLEVFKKREHYWEYRKFQDNLTNPWGLFACRIKNISEDLIELSTAAAIADDNFDKEREWLKHHQGVLSDDEKRLIETIDYMIRDKSFPFHTEEEGTTIASKKPKERNKLIVQKLRETVESLSNSIKTLEEDILGNNSTTDKKKKTTDRKNQL